MGEETVEFFIDRDPRRPRTLRVIGETVARDGSKRVLVRNEETGKTSRIKRSRLEDHVRFDRVRPIAAYTEIDNANTAD